MPRRLLLLFVAILISAATVVLMQRWMNGQIRAHAVVDAPQAATPVTVQIVVAKEDIPLGATIKAEQLRWQAWPREAVTDAYIVDGKGKIEDFVGTVVRSRMAAGEPITEGRIVRPGDRSLMAAMLAPGERAVTVNVNASSGMGGFILTGDRVDLILSRVVHSGSTGDDSRHVSETILTDIRVLGIDQHISDDKKDATVPKTVTLEVTPKQAEVVSVASELGVLSLSLRALGAPQTGDKTANDNADGTQTWDNEVTHYVAADPAPRPAPKVEVVRGTEVSAAESPAAAGHEVRKQ
jgi:pilus assembly protein CpaB